MDERTVKWTCNIRSDFTENLIEYDKNHNPYTGYLLRCAYRDGVYVMKSKIKYKEYINAVSDYFMNCSETNLTVAQVLYDVGIVKKDDKDTEYTKSALEKARKVLCKVMELEYTEENLELMKKINGIYYSVCGDEFSLCIYDLFYLMRKCNKIAIHCGENSYTVDFEDKTLICEGTVYQSANEFFQNFFVDGKPVYSLASKVTVTK